MVWWLIKRTASTSSTSCLWYHFSPAPRWLGWGWWEARWPCSLRKSISELQIQQQWQFSQAQINEGELCLFTFPAALFKALPHMITSDSWLFFFVFLYKQKTGYLLNPGHLDIYSGAPGDNALCLSPTAWCADQCSSSVHSHCPGTQQFVLQSVTGIVTHGITYKIKLWHTGSHTTPNCDTQDHIKKQTGHQSTAALRRLHCSADVHCTW